MFYVYQYLEHVNDNVEGGIGDEHNMVPTSQSFRPWRPVHDVTMLDHLKKTKSALPFFTIIDIVSEPSVFLAVLAVSWDF